MDIATESREALVPTLVLQPLVENAIKHGLSQNEAGGRLEIGAHVDGARVVLTVRDNGGGIGSSNAEGDGIGVRNTRERLQQLYGDDHSLPGNADGGGAIATVSFHTGADLTLASVIDGSTP
ncbi:MAG: hypothetical protein IPJ56_01650 [Gemmatimonadetes bacterium]|nr:hypothetical protein [Gemmatimonadota bacterium]